MRKPFVCPVCGGTKLVPHGFYDNINGGFPYSTTSTIPETCRSCQNGIVWGDNEDENIDFKFELIDNNLPHISEINNTLFDIRALIPSLTESDIQHLQWLHSRFYVLYNEYVNPEFLINYLEWMHVTFVEKLNEPYDVDFLIRFREIIDKLKKLLT
jgi:hypothetical protein